jgi:quercetin dioxygenase-like cupin family protein
MVRDREDPNCSRDRERVFFGRDSPWGAAARAALGGAIQGQVDDGPVTTYRAGESFSGPPGDRHGMSENASSTEPARLLAVLVVGTAGTPPTTAY